MAWLQNLAGKAEDLLVKFDQNAANVFSDSNYKLLENTDNIIEPSHESRSITPPEAEVAITVENKETKSKGDFKDSTLFHDHYEMTICNDNVSVISEKSKLSENDDSGIVFNTPLNMEKHDSPLLPVNESFTKKGFKSEYSGMSSKSGSSQNSFILMDDVAIKYEEKLANLERENNDIHQQLMNIRHLYSEIQNENCNLQGQLERTNETLSVTQKEMEQYRVRAQRILQEKEKLIMLKGNNSHFEDASENKLLANYTKELKKELTFQEEKYEQLYEKFSKINGELPILQQNLMLTQNENQNLKQTLQNSLANESKIRATMEEEYHIKSRELQVVVQDLTQKNNIIASMSQEIVNLKEQLKQRANYLVNDDLESRLHALTQTLMAKQNTLETITTERNALRLQLEKLENEHHKVIVQMQRNVVKNSTFVEPVEVKQQIPHFLKISPFDAGVTRKVKHAYSSLDAVSIRTGVFLRRYPAARVFVFCYMVLLHVLVFLILCIYVP